MQEAIEAMSIELELEDWFTLLTASQGHKVPRLNFIFMSKTALITGATSGIGWATAHLLAQHSFKAGTLRKATKSTR